MYYICYMIYKTVAKSLKTNIKDRIYFIAKDFNGYFRYLNKHQLNSKNFFYVASERIAEGMPENSNIFALKGWKLRDDEKAIIEILKNKKAKLTEIELSDITDLMMLLNKE